MLAKNIFCYFHVLAVLLDLSLRHLSLYIIFRLLTVFGETASVADANNVAFRMQTRARSNISDC